MLKIPNLQYHKL